MFDLPMEYVINVNKIISNPAIDASRRNLKMIDAMYLLIIRSVCTAKEVLMRQKENVCWIKNWIVLEVLIVSVDLAQDHSGITKDQLPLKLQQQLHLLPWQHRTHKTQVPQDLLMVDSLQVHLDLLMVDSHQASTEVQLEVLQEDSTLSQPSPLFRTAKFLTQLTEVASFVFMDSSQATKNA